MKARIGMCGFVVFVVAGVLGILSTNAAAQSAPQQYSITQVSALFGPAMTVQIYRDGQMAMQESSGPPADNFPKGMHTRTFYDLSAGKQYTLDLINASTGCGTATFSGDWGDPFAMSAEMLNDPNSKSAKAMGTETVAGVSAKVFQTTDPRSQADIKYWLDDAHHLVLKLTMAAPGSAPKTLLEVKQISLAKPAASLLAIPPACKAAAASAPPTDAERIAAETGGNAADYANAIMPPASNSSCNVLFKVVRAKTLQPIPGFRVGLDTQIDPNHMPSYSMGGPQGFSGGNIHEVTGQFRNGSLRIENAPANFDVELLFGQAGGASALIYRQCYGPETTLMFVVKNPQKLGDGGDWLWVKK